MAVRTRTNLSEEENDDWRFMGMIVKTEIVEKVMGVDKSMMGSQPAYQYTNKQYYEFRSSGNIPNSSKYLGIPLSIPPSLNTQQIYEMLNVIFPQANAELKLNYTRDEAMGGNDQIIFDGYQFLTPRDASMINKGLFTTLSLHNKLIGSFRLPYNG